MQSRTKPTSNPWNRWHDKGEYRSGLEEAISDQLRMSGLTVRYETHVIPYTMPESRHRYTPDFVLDNGIIIETKGRFTPKDRQKMALVKSQRPELDIRIIFSNAKARIAKNSKTTYAAWCEKHGIPYADKAIPQAWLEEKADADKTSLLTHLLKKAKAPQGAKNCGA